MELIVTLALAAAAGSTGGAQIGYQWHFGELFAKADLVVIAEHVTTNETGRLAHHPSLPSPASSVEQPRLPTVQLTTELSVLAVLRQDGAAGVSTQAPFRLTHYRIDWDEWRFLNPPVPGVPPPGVVNTGSVLDLSRSAGPYLLFLTRGTDGGYEPVSGHVVPTASVYMLREMTR
jgi:hypothetical protein